MNTNLKILLLIDFSEEYGRALLRGITRYSQVYGPWSFCKMPPFVREKYGVNGILDFARKWGAQGIVGQLDNTQEISKLIDSGICIVAQDFKERFTEIPNITSDYDKAGAMAAGYFLAKGYKNFAFYGFTEIVWSRERALGYSNRLKEAGYTVHSFNNTQKNKHQLWYYSQSPLSDWLLKLPKPVALFACDDNQASHIAEACKLAGIRVPDEVSILGVDNDEMICNMSNPPTSSICLDTENAGFKVAELMENMILKKTDHFDDIFVESTSIFSRQSTDIFAVNDPEVLKALQFIRETITQKIQVSDVIKNVALSRRAIEKRFVDTIERSIYQEILFRKMERATQLLLQTKYSILEIACQSGFDDDKNFARMFQKIHQLTPLQYRKKFGTVH
ncbi:MAG: DNA-binding transcriptional regulator [Peptostreptococcaceae bacterium]|nr:DNA-binding transcriptional regulator [Peptostreptococcaceae bacterium]